MEKTHYGKLSIGLIVAWFLFSLVAPVLHIYQNSWPHPPLAMGVAVLAPIVFFGAWWAASPGFRQFALSLNPRTLTLVQAWRVAGFVFIVSQAYGILPGVFAFPAGWGDVAIGATAILVAERLANPSHRNGFILWQVLGMADLVMAVGLGTTAGLIHPNGIPTSAMTVLPLSIVPTFAVPLLTILHIICIAQARRWPVENQSRAVPAAARV